MAYSTTNLYPEDLNGTNPANLITNEPQTLQAPGPDDYYFIIPKAAPFFVESLIVVDSATNNAYVEGTDYEIGHQFVEAMDSTGRPIAGSIRFMRPTITGQVKLTYRTLGGNWGFSDTDILRELANKLVNPLIRSWGDIAPLPYSFPPLPHDQRIDTLVGSKEINETLEHIAEILEASAEGTSQSHITDYNNPHKVTAEQVGLGNVQNYGMATDLQHLEATSNTLYTNPRGVELMIEKFAITPLDTHISDQNNPHKVTKQQVNLGNVQNYGIATNAQATDVTNNTSYMTPYTTSLLVQKLSNDPRLDQLILDFNEHITATNPHHITPSMIGTYTAEQIDNMIATVSKGGDAATFGGESPEAWEDKFPTVADANDILEEMTNTWYTAQTEVTKLDVSDPITPEEENLYQARKIYWSFGDHNAYALYNSRGDGIIVASSDIPAGFPTGPVPTLSGKWGTSVTGNYYIEANGGVKAWGDSPVTIPTAYSSAAAPVAGKKSVGVYPSKDWVIMALDNGNIVSVSRGLAANAEPTVLLTGALVWNLYVSNGTKDSRVLAVYEDENLQKWIPLGDSSWKAAAQAALDRAVANSEKVVDMRIGNDKVVVITSTADDAPNRVWVFQINFDTNITLTDISTTTMVTNHTTGEVLAASAVTGVTQVAGSYGHSVLTKPISTGAQLCDLLSFGDNSEGQLEIPATSAPFYGIAAGDGFTITVNQFHFAEFWGDSPDNSLLYLGGANIVP